VLISGISFSCCCTNVNLYLNPDTELKVNIQLEPKKILWTTTLLQRKVGKNPFSYNLTVESIYMDIKAACITFNVAICWLFCRAPSIDMRPVDIGMAAVSQAGEEKSVLAGLQGEVLLKRESAATVGIQSLVDADFSATLQGTGAGIVEMLKNKPKRGGKINTVSVLINMAT
jgi:hypothetical protein